MTCPKFWLNSRLQLCLLSNAPVQRGREQHSENDKNCASRPPEKPFLDT